MNPSCSKLFSSSLQISVNKFTFPVSSCRVIHLKSCSLQNFRNPLQRKSFGRNQKNDFKEITRICATILGNGAFGQPRCIGLFTDHKGMLFNCGESVGRTLREYEGTFHEIRHIFITRRDWSNLSGIPDIYLTHEAYGVQRLSLFGPPGVEHFALLNTGEAHHTKLEKRTTPYLDEAFEIKSISIVANLPANSRRRNREISEEVYCYACKIFKESGELIPEKLVELNVPMGPHLLTLKNGEDVVLSSGRIIRSSDVSYQSNKEILLIVDCPTNEFLLPFVTNGELNRYQSSSDVDCKVTTIFHFTPLDIMKTKLYQNWMKKFHPDINHIVLNSACASVSSQAVYQSQSFFHLLHPDIFKLLPTPQADSLNINVPNVICAPPMFQIHYRPKKELNWSNVMKYSPEKFIQESNFYPSFVEEVNILKSKMETESQASYKDYREYPDVIFLGTCSSTSTAYRNVTGILLRISNDKSILLDCGEGTFLQLLRYFGTENINSELKKISCIFISHYHTDHYMGLFQVIKSRNEAFKKSDDHYQKLALILPYKIRDIFKEFCMLFEMYDYRKVKIFPCRSLDVEIDRERLFKFVGDIELETFAVKHCSDAHGISIKKGEEWKIVYSGDSAPCQKIIDAGENCTLLIHEASIEDNCQNEAMERKHSTPSQVIDISEKMNAQHTIMTHFSKRYLAVPVFQNTSKTNIGCAFDFMRVQLHQLHLISFFLPAVKNLFQEQLEKHAERTGFYENFQTSFFKTYKSKANL